MKTLTKYLAAAAAGYALHAYAKKDVLLTKDALKHSDAQYELLEAATWPRKPTFLERQTDRLVSKIHHMLFDGLVVKPSLTEFAYKESKHFGPRPTRYNRFGRRSN